MSDAIVTKREAEPPKAKEQFSGGPTALRPANAPRWLHYFDTDLGHDVVWDGSQWRLGPPGDPGLRGVQGAVSSVDITGGGFGTGLSSSFYNTMDLSGSPVKTIFTDVNLAWPDGGPVPISGLNATNVSARWTGVILAPVTGSYTFSTISDDGVRLYLNSVLVINNWSVHATSLDTAPAFNFVANQQLNVTLEWFQNLGEAQIRLQWAYPGQSTQVVPISAMSPTAV